MTSDGELVTSVIHGDAAAYGLLVERYEQSLRAVAFFVLRDLHLAEDVVQDSFVAAYRNLPALRNRAAFGPWMLRIVRRQARAAGRRQLHLVPLDRAAELSASDSSLDIDSEKLLAAIMKLPKEERLVLMLRQFDGHDMAAIAQITRDSLSTITKRISRAHAHLRELLKEYPR